MSCNTSARPMKRFSLRCAPIQKQGRVGYLLLSPIGSSRGTISKSPAVDPPVAPPKGDEIGTDVRSSNPASGCLAVLTLRSVSSLRRDGAVSWENVSVSFSPATWATYERASYRVDGFRQFDVARPARQPQDTLVVGHKDGCRSQPGKHRSGPWRFQLWSPAGDSVPGPPELWE